MQVGFPAFFHQLVYADCVLRAAAFLTACDITADCMVLTEAGFRRALSGLGTPCPVRVAGFGLEKRPKHRDEP